MDGYKYLPIVATLTHLFIVYPSYVDRAWYPIRKYLRSLVNNARPRPIP
jgi:hypothetical protein